MLPSKLEFRDIFNLNQVTIQYKYELKDLIPHQWDVAMLVYLSDKILLMGTSGNGTAYITKPCLYFAIYAVQIIKIT